MRTIIDADLIAYRCAAANDKEDLGINIWQADQMVIRILSEVQADEYKLYLSGENNFRYIIFSDYKANRRDQVRPRHLEGIREFLVTNWDATIVDGYEADDAIGILSTQNPQDIISSIDKDLKQLPVTHYNFVNRVFDIVTPIQGWYNFYTQLLVGDTTDNIKGCPKVGKVKAAKALQGCNTERQLYERCIEQYKLAYCPPKYEGTEWEVELNLNANLLYILRREDEYWKAPSLVQEVPVRVLCEPEPEHKPSS